MSVRSLENNDYKSWRPVWQENMQHQVTDEVTTNTWKWICDTSPEVGGLGFFQDRELCGILHYILHPTTGSLRPVCYMQDLYVLPVHRQQGFAKQLLKALAEKGLSEGWERIYWVADNDNKQAQALYKNIGVKLNFGMHVLPLNMKI